jgi:hypothetical protein
MEIEPIERIEFEAARLIEEHAPRWRDPNKEAVFRVASSPEFPFEGLVRYARWPKAEIPRSVSARSRITVREGFYDYVPSAVAGVVEWHLNFADPPLFVAYGSPLMAQDEVQVAEHPILGSVREVLLSMEKQAVTCESWGGPTPVTVSGVQRRCAIDTWPDPAAGHSRDLYGNAFARASRAEVLAATRPLSPPTLSNILAISAPPGGRGAYTRSEMQDVLDTAFAGFGAARRESESTAGAGVRTIIHTGFWGCGAFGGNRRLMTMLQALAADLAEVDVVFHAGKADGATLAGEALEDYARILDVTHEGSRILDEWVRREFRWGVSDGN